MSDQDAKDPRHFDSSTAKDAAEGEYYDDDHDHDDDDNDDKLEDYSQNTDEYHHETHQDQHKGLMKLSDIAANHYQHAQYDSSRAVALGSDEILALTDASVGSPGSTAPRRKVVAERLPPVMQYSREHQRRAAQNNNKNNSDTSNTNTGIQLHDRNHQPVPVPVPLPPPTRSESELELERVKTAVLALTSPDSNRSMDPRYHDYDYNDDDDDDDGHNHTNNDEYGSSPQDDNDEERGYKTNTSGDPRNHDSTLRNAAPPSRLRRQEQFTSGSSNRMDPARQKELVGAYRYRGLNRRNNNNNNNTNNGAERRRNGYLSSEERGVASGDNNDDDDDSISFDEYDRDPSIWAPTQPSFESSMSGHPQQVFMHAQQESPEDGHSSETKQERDKRFFRKWLAIVLLVFVIVLVLVIVVPLQVLNDRNDSSFQETPTSSPRPTTTPRQTFGPRTPMPTTPPPVTAIPTSSQAPTASSRPSASPAPTYTGELVLDNGDSTLLRRVGVSDFGQSLILFPTYPSMQQQQQQQQQQNTTSSTRIAVSMPNFNNGGGAVQILDTTNSQQSSMTSQSSGQLLFGRRSTTSPNYKEAFGTHIRASHDGQWLAIGGHQSVYLYGYNTNTSEWTHVGKAIGRQIDDSDSSDEMPPGNNTNTATDLLTGRTDWAIQEIVLTTSESGTDLAPNATSVVYLTVSVTSNDYSVRQVSSFYMPVLPIMATVNNTDSTNNSTTDNIFNHSNTNTDEEDSDDEEDGGYFASLEWYSLAPIIRNEPRVLLSNVNGGVMVCNDTNREFLVLHNTSNPFNTTLSIYELGPNQTSWILQQAATAIVVVDNDSRNATRADLLDTQDTFGRTLAWNSNQKQLVQATVNGMAVHTFASLAGFVNSTTYANAVIIPTPFMIPALTNTVAMSPDGRWLVRAWLSPGFYPGRQTFGVRVLAQVYHDYSHRNHTNETTTATDGTSSEWEPIGTVPFGFFVESPPTAFAISVAIHQNNEHDDNVDSTALLALGLSVGTSSSNNTQDGLVRLVQVHVDGTIV